MSDGFQYGDLIFLGVIAIFVMLRLRAMLGRDEGIDPKTLWKQPNTIIQQDNVVPFPLQEKPVDPLEQEMEARITTNPQLGEGLKAIKAADGSFNFQEFLAGAKIAFEWVVDAYNKQDKEKLKMVLSEERFQHFSESLDAQAQAETRFETTLVAITQVHITEAGMRGTIAWVNVEFLSEQMNVTKDKENKIVGNDNSVIEHAHDLFTFERDVNSRDPNWKIVGT